MFTTATTRSSIITAWSDWCRNNIDNTLFRICSRLRNDGYTKADALALLEPIAIAKGATPDHLPEKIDHVWASYEPKKENTAGVDAVESLSSFLDKEERVTWLVPKVVASEVIGFVAGLPGVCKTWLMMDLAIELARGGLWCGTMPTNKAKVLFIDQERAATETRRRFKALFAGKNLNYRELDNNLTIMAGSTVPTSKPGRSGTSGAVMFERRLSWGAR